MRRRWNLFRKKVARKELVFYTNNMIISQDFYLSDPIVAARALVGAYLCRRMPDGTVIRAQICELELYTEAERGCHAYAGRSTARNNAMFMTGGCAYVYLCYGLHNMLNVVLGRAGTAAAVLIRALEYPGCNGPGRLTRVLGITRADNKMGLTGGADIWIEPRPGPVEIIAGPRIGIDYAGDDAALPWRFCLAGSDMLSAPAG